MKKEDVIKILIGFGLLIIGIIWAWSFLKNYGVQRNLNQKFEKTDTILQYQIDVNKKDIKKIKKHIQYDDSI